MSDASMLAKEEILRRIREALPGESIDALASYARIARTYTRSGSLSRQEVIALFIDRLLDYDADIFELDGEERIAQAVAEALGRKGETSLLAAADFPECWLPDQIHVIRDLPGAAPLTTPQLDAVSAVITACEVAVASTGTIFLVHKGDQGRRALTLLPDHHICVVRRDQVVETIPEAIALSTPHAGKPMTTISGPSATSDIEMTRIRGVHGPRRLSVILYDQSRVK